MTAPLDLTGPPGLARPRAGTYDSNPDRLAHVLAMRAEGHTLEDIGGVYGVSRERIRQLVQRAVGEESRARNPIAVVKALRDPSAASLHSIVLACGMSHAVVEIMLGELGLTAAAHRLFRWRKWRRTQAKRAAVIAELQAFVAKYGRSPTSAELGFKPGTPRHTDLSKSRAAVRVLFGGIPLMFAAAGIASRPLGWHGRVSRPTRRTHCKRGGHELTPDNVYTDKKGGRTCKTCTRDRKPLAKRPRAKRAESEIVRAVRYFGQQIRRQCDADRTGDEPGAKRYQILIDAAALDIETAITERLNPVGPT